MVTVETLLAVQAHRAQGGTDGPSTRDCGKAPTDSTWACCQTRLEKSGAKGARACAIMAVGYAIRSPLLAKIGDERTLPLSRPNG